ncbi:MAG TPA: TetR/AcrR family transcriptional regulator [Erysipelotrichaceae bacterium]|nr:TetR/AcrR family transcriptional regulator [Erysipelotrichaceae bacterium]
MAEELIIDKKKQLLDAALHVFATQGFEKASMREIAANAGLTTGAIYYHYKNKDDLYYDAVKESAYFVHKLSEKDKDSKLKTNQEMFEEISTNVRDRMSKEIEQRLLILLTAYAITKGGRIKEKYRLDYNEIIDKVAKLYFYAFGVENQACQKRIAAILVAALDGVALQYSLGVLDINDEVFKDTFVNFFAQSIPIYIKQYSNQ